MLRHAPAALDLLDMDLPGALGRITVPAAQLVERPGEVDRGRARGSESRRGGFEVLPAPCGQRVPVGGGDSNRRSAPHRKRSDRLRDLGRGAARQLDYLVGQPPLVENNYRVVLESDDL